MSFHSPSTYAVDTRDFRSNDCFHLSTVPDQVSKKAASLDCVGKSTRKKESKETPEQVRAELKAFDLIFNVLFNQGRQERTMNASAG